MLNYPSINPVALDLGPLQIHWYGLMYVIGFTAAWLLAFFRARQSNGRWTTEQVSDLIFYSALGVVVGGRLGYVLIYNLPEFLNDPWSLFRIWQGGMSFHGGLIGVGIAMWSFSRKSKKSYFEVTDFLIPLVPIGLGAGRIGNFINGELWGRVTTVPWGMAFPNAGDLPRHPSQIYEFLLEGVLLFILLWVYSSRPRPQKAVTGLFLMCYGMVRFFVEFFREPDPQLGSIAFHWMTMGQLLSLPMIMIGILLLYCSYQVTLVDEKSL